MPATNRDYWVPKFERNQRRDREVDEALESDGWTVLRFWEHEDAGEVAEAVRAAVVEAGRARSGDRRSA
jgi:DNA mismatch endonuclease (patch repair protein)